MSKIVKYVKRLANSNNFLLEIQGVTYGMRWEYFKDFLQSDTFSSGTTVFETVQSDSVQADTITETTAGAGITLDKAIIRNNTAAAINSTATATPAQVAGGLITSTSAAATGITLPTATDLATALGATKGTIFDFVLDNSAGANTVTIIVGAGITASGFPGTNTLTLAASTTVGIATFRITFISATAATLARIS